MNTAIALLLQAAVSLLTGIGTECKFILCDPRAGGHRGGTCHTDFNAGGSNASYRFFNTGRYEYLADDR